VNKPRNQRTFNGSTRYVHAQRARKLRRRGEDVRPFGSTSTGRARFVWFRIGRPAEIF